MSTLVLELAESQMVWLEQVAQQRQMSVQAVVTELIATMAHSSTVDTAVIEHDPLFLIKAHESNAPADLSQHSDRYLYGETM